MDRVRAVGLIEQQKKKSRYRNRLHCPISVKHYYAVQFIPVDSYLYMITLVYKDKSENPTLFLPWQNKPVDLVDKSDEMASLYCLIRSSAVIQKV